MPVALDTCFEEHELVVGNPGETPERFLRTGMDAFVLDEGGVERRQGP